MKGKPAIVSVTVKNPLVFRELEPCADAILVEFGGITGCGAGGDYGKI